MSASNHFITKHPSILPCGVGRVTDHYYEHYHSLFPQVPADLPLNTPSWRPSFHPANFIIIHPSGPLYRAAAAPSSFTHSCRRQTTNKLEKEAAH